MAVDDDQNNEEIIGEVLSVDDEGDVESLESEREDEDDDSDVVVTIGEESPPTDDEEHSKAPEWVKDLRKSHREQTRRIKELESQLEVKQAPKPIELGEKPRLEHFEYDEEVFETELTAWHERKRKLEEQSAQDESRKKTEQEAWSKKLSNYQEAKVKLNAKGFDEAEAEVLENFDTTKQGIIVKAARNPALVVLALGRNPKKLKELSSINDPVEFTYALALLENDLKLTRKTPPSPETPVRATGTGAGSVDNTLERLRAEAAKTGDYSKVSKYKRDNRQR